MNSGPRRNGGLTAINGAMTLLILLLIVQIWLFRRRSNRIWRAIARRPCLARFSREFSS